MATSNPINRNHNAAMMVTNPAALPSHNDALNKNQATTPMTQLPQHHRYQHGRTVSPGVSPMPTREQIVANPNHPAQHPNQFGSSPVNINNNAMTWQHQQQQQHQQLQLHTSRSCDSEDLENVDTGSDISSIPMGSIRPDSNYDPANDPLSPENIDKPFVAPLEITIHVVKGRRRKTLATVGSYHSSTTHTTQSTTVTPPQVSALEDDKELTPNHPEKFQSSEPPTPQTGNSSIPKLRLINSYTTDESDSHSFSGSADQFQSAEDLLYLEEDRLELQEMQENKSHKNRKGMVRRELNRRVKNLKKIKKKKKKKSNSNNENTASIEFSQGFETNDVDDDSDASGNKILIQLKIEDTTEKAAKQQSKSFKLKSKSLYKASKELLKHHKRTNSSMRMIVGQENGC